ncbi:hypothetical protein MNBD_ALPHA11-145 [hydrothermal vent metagenome]|uniref:Uncharacterized protein n=1 Tax=hydrothermal vent metagenome TaxID=652676 RepID=A0A3B0U7D0_9ZZZZ
MPPYLRNCLPEGKFLSNQEKGNEACPTTLICLIFILLCD